MRTSPLLLTIAVNSFILVCSFTSLMAQQQTDSVQQAGSVQQLRQVVVEDTRDRYSGKKTEYVSRMPLDNLENPQSYSVATKELLQEQQIVDYNSAVRAIPGIALSTESYQGIPEAHMRGFAVSPYIRNGIYYMNLVATDPQTIERIEAIKGPSATLFGSQGVSYGGLLNRVTKKPFNRHAVEAGVNAGSFGLTRLTADVNTPLKSDNSVLLRVNAAVSSEQSFQDNGFQKKILFAPSLYYRINSRLDVLIDAEISSVNRPALTSYPVYGIPGRPEVQHREELDLDYFRSYASNKVDYPESVTQNLYTQFNYLFSGGWKLSLNLAYADFAFNSGTVGLTLANDTLMKRDLYDFYWQYNSMDIQPNLTGEFNIGNIRNRVVAGLDYQWIRTLPTGYLTDSADSFNYLSRYPALPVKQIRTSDKYAQSYFEMEFEQKAYAAYVSDVITFTDRLNLMLALRYDRYEDGGYQSRNNPGGATGPSTGAFAPKIGATYQLLKNKLSLFGNYMQGIRYVAPDMEGNAFRPERAQQTEGGIKLDVPGGKISSTLSYYHIRVKDRVRPDPANPNRSLQDGTQESKGIDVDLIVLPLPGLSIIAGYGYNDSRYTKASENIQGKRPYGTPENSGNAWVSYTLLKGPAKGLGFGLGAVYSDECFATDINTMMIPSFLVFNGNVFYSHPRFRASVGLDNIGNEKYYDFYGAPQLPRRLLASLALKF